MRSNEFLTIHHESRAGQHFLPRRHGAPAGGPNLKANSGRREENLPDKPGEPRVESGAAPRGGPAVPCGQREQALDFPVVTPRTGDLGVAPYQELEIMAAAGAAVFVDRHVGRVAEMLGKVKRMAEWRNGGMAEWIIG